MRIDLHSPRGRPITRVDADLAAPPPVIHSRRPDGAIEEHFLDWDGALDDEGHLRKCPACGCTDLYIRRLFPPLTSLVVVIVISAAIIALYGLNQMTIDTLIGLAVVVAVGNFIFVRFSPRYLACYRCGSGYHDVPIPRDRHEWDANLAARYEEEARSSLGRAGKS
jgi:hypothetical protein